MNGIHGIKRIIGIDIKELLAVKQMLNVLGLEMKDMVEFLDKDKVQLFARLKSKNRHLQKKIDEIRKVTE